MEEPENRGEEEPRRDGVIHISEDVIVELARKTIQGIPNIQTVSRLGTKFGIGRKGSDGIRISIEENAVEGGVPAISVDAYVLTRYGRRIPDLAWDVQEKVKANLERYTGYSVKAVNINVQGIYIDEPVLELSAEATGGEGMDAAEEAGESSSDVTE